MTATIDRTKGTLTLVIEVHDPVSSASGKSQVVASTHGFTATTAQVNGKPVKVSINAII